MKCYKALFSKDGLIRNIGSYVLLFVIFIFIVSAILFYKCGYNLLEDQIKEIYFSKKEKKIDKSNYKHFNIKETNVIYDDKIKKNKNNKGNDKTINNKNIKNKIIMNKNIKNISSKNKKNKKVKNVTKKNRIINPLFLKENNESGSNSKIELKINKFIIYNNNLKKDKNKKTKKEKDIKIVKNKKNYNNYSDYELNYFIYENALLYDKRSCGAYYCSLIKYKHPIIFYLCITNDYNSMIIKIDLLCLSLSYYYFINTLFFDETTIHKIYEDEGIYNFIYLAPFISYSFLISHTLSLISKYIFLSERNLYDIKRQERIEKVVHKMERAKRCIIIKYITFFCLGSIFLIFFWYYLSSFGAV